MKFKTNLALAPFCYKGDYCKNHVCGPELETAEEAAKYGEILLAAGVVVGYRVMFQLENAKWDYWYNHELVKFEPVEYTNLPGIRYVL